MASKISIIIKLGSNPDSRDLFNAYRLFCDDQKLISNMCYVIFFNTLFSTIGFKLAGRLKVEKVTEFFPQRKKFVFSRFYSSEFVKAFKSLKNQDATEHDNISNE